VRIDWDGEQSRDYVYVGDVVKANLAALTRGSGEIYVIGAGKKTTVNQIYKALAAATGFEAPITQAPRRAGDAREIYFNPAKAARELGWKAEVDLQTGMSETIAYFRERTPAAPASIA
jgi:UDP-glucose 4-epimerase